MANVETFLYGGYSLPDIRSVWTDELKQIYPYAIINGMDSGGELLLSDSPFVVNSEGNIVNTNGSAFVLYVYGLIEWIWGAIYNEWTLSSSTITEVTDDTFIDWTSFDILNEDGSVFLLATTPVRVDSKIDVAFVKVEGDYAYSEAMASYGGHILPIIPDYDKDVYRYLYISNSSFTAFACSAPIAYVGKEGANQLGPRAITDTTCIFCSLSKDKSSYEAFGEPFIVNAGDLICGNSYGSYRPIWANHDVLGTHDSVYIAASEPTLVGTGITDTSVTVKFTCTNLLYTDKVYQIKAWVYPKGTRYTDAKITYTTPVLFGGPEYTESHTFIGLKPNTDYELYTAIIGGDDATDHNALVTFSTPESNQTMYIGGMANRAKKVKDIYIGVNGVARRVIKTYIGVNGIARVCKGIIHPTLLPSNTWYKGATDASTLTEIRIVDSYIPTSNVTESWSADTFMSGAITCYVEDTVLTIAGNGSGKIMANENSDYLFCRTIDKQYLSSVVHITGLDMLDTSKVKNMEYMFYNCTSLTSLDLSTFDTSKVTNMACMFSYCDSIETVDLHNFDTRNVTIMEAMFRNCASLTSLDLRSFNTRNVTSFYYMFYGASNLTNIYGGLNWVTIQADSEYSDHMFDGCGTTRVRTEYVALSGQNSWYKSNIPRSYITEIRFMDSYIPKSTAMIRDSWPADVGGLGYIMCYVEGTILTIAGNGTGKIGIRSISNLFYDSTKGAFSSVKRISGLEILSSINDSISMHGMFRGCSSLTSLDLRSFGANSVYDTSYMFDGCSSLSSLNLSRFNTTGCSNMKYMFNGCTSLTSLDLSTFNTSKVTNMSCMFKDCHTLSHLDLGNFETTALTNTASMFEGCSSLISIDMSLATASAVTNANRMFYGCQTLKSINVATNWDMSAVLDSTDMFTNCGVSNVVKPNSVFAHAKQWYQGITDISTITEIHIVDMYTPSDMSTVTEYWYADCDRSGTITCYIEGTILTISGNGTGKIVANPNSNLMFDGFNSVTNIFGIEILDTRHVVHMGEMFQNCQKLTSLDLSMFDTSKVTTMASMFKDCHALSDLDLSGFDTSRVCDMSRMFYNCGITTLDLSRFNTSKVQFMNHMFYSNRCSTLDVSNFDTGMVTDMKSMFNGCWALTSLDLRNFVTSAVQDMSYMFYDCSKLSKIYVSNTGWDLRYVYSIYRRFYKCSASSVTKV